VIVRTSNVYRMKRLLFLPVLVVALVYGLGWWLLLDRKDDPLPPKGVDAIVVLAGSQKRLPVALDLIHRHVAGTLVISDTSIRVDPPRYRLCHGTKPPGYRLVCERAKPFSTRGEARMTAALVKRYHWRSVAVVSSRFHLFRAKILFGRCTSARLVMRGTSTDSLAWKAMSIPLEWVKLARSVVLRGC
jgi:uncharacterized SAM-binding protein YcdF (DUF218 family)